MFFTIFTFICYFHNNYTIKYCVFSSNKNTKTYLKKPNRSGNDERFVKNTTDANHSLELDIMQLYNFKKNLEKKRMLDILQSKNVNIYDKVNLLKDNTITSYNINAGGLKNDFE